MKRARVSPKYGKRGIKASSNGYKQKHDKHNNKKNKNMDYFNCGKPDHFSRDCTEPKIIFNHNHPSNLYVSSFTKFVSFWTIDSGATNH
jgi:hypothetical protein